MTDRASVQAMDAFEPAGKNLAMRRLSPGLAALIAGAALLAGCTSSAAPARVSAITPSSTTAAETWTPPPRTKTSGCLSRGGLPDPACTPGALDPRVTQADIRSTICTSGYTEKVRPPIAVTEKIKRDQMSAYGLVGVRLGDEELDHLISLELGGAPDDVANLWPQPWNGDANAHMKDAVETYLHDQVCRGAMQLTAAQRQIATDWLSLYHTHRLTPAQ